MLRAGSVMRGNEVELLAVEVRRQFQIPMRGNETIAVQRGLGSATSILAFQIPMRGNEC